MPPMNNISLLATQKNDVLEVIREAGLDPSAFTWQESRSRFRRVPVAATLVHRPTGYYFKFDYNGDYVIAWSPGAFSIEHEVVCYGWGEDVLSNVKEWLENIEQEKSVEDLWQAFSGETKLIETPSESGSDNSLFTPTEKKQVRQYLKKIKRHLTSGQKLTKEREKFIEARLAYLEEAATRVGRKDWLILLIGTLFQTAITIGLAPESARTLFRFASQLARQLLGSILSFPVP